MFLLAVYWTSGHPDEKKNQKTKSTIFRGYSLLIIQRFHSYFHTEDKSRPNCPHIMFCLDICTIVLMTSVKYVTYDTRSLFFHSLPLLHAGKVKYHSTLHCTNVSRCVCTCRQTNNKTVKHTKGHWGPCWQMHSCSTSSNPPKKVHGERREWIILLLFWLLHTISTTNKTVYISTFSTHWAFKDVFVIVLTSTDGQSLVWLQSLCS